MDSRHNPHMIASFGRSLDSHVTHDAAVCYGPITQPPQYRPVWVGRLQEPERRSYPHGATGNARPPIAADLRGPFRYRERNPRISCECVLDHDGIIRLQPRQRRRGSSEGACRGCGGRAPARSGVPRASDTVRPGPPHHLRRTQNFRLETRLKRGGRRSRASADSGCRVKSPRPSRQPVPRAAALTPALPGAKSRGELLSGEVRGWPAIASRG